MTDNQQNNTGRDGLGRFTTGNSGRPLGAKNKTPRAVLAQVMAMEQGATQKLWEAVNMGQDWAIKFVLSKVLPNSRTIEFEGLSVEDLKVALTSGDISPDEGSQLVSVLKGLKELESLEEIRKRIADLEQAINE